MRSKEQRERDIACAKRSYENNKERKKQAIREWNAKNPFNYMVAQKRYEAKKRGIEFDLDAAHVSSLMPKDGLCPVLRIVLVLPCQSAPRGNIGARDEAVSLDRIDPAFGYIKGNVAILSVKANRMKNDCTDPAAFERLAEYVRSVKRVI